ncbi:MAG TPA: macro domain-containing protein, partial [Anaerolineae bacterium]|nr:macro domain-containing protein [Anaerolineae bacterium]
MSVQMVLFEYTLSTGQIIRVVQGDLTVETSEAIVNAANEWLQHGGGVAGAIRRQGGEVIQQESNAWVQQHGLVQTGSTAITGAGRLPAKYVIHAVGPVWGSGNDEQKLASAVRSALSLAD